MNRHLAPPEGSNEPEKDHDRLIQWLEKRISETVSQQVNASDKSDLRKRMAYTQVVTREVAKVSEILKESKLAQSKGSSRGSSIAELQAKVSQHSNSLLKLKDELAQKMKSLDQLRSLLSEAIETVEELFKMVDVILKTERPHEEEEINLMRSRVEQRSALVAELYDLYHKIQSDVEENDFSMHEEISSQMNNFEDRWTELKLKCKKIGIQIRPINNYNQTMKSSRPVGDISQEEKMGGFSPVSQVSSVSCDAEGMITSRTTYSNSPSSFLSEEVVPLHTNQKEEDLHLITSLLHDIKHCINAILRHVSINGADACNPSSIKELLRRYQGNLQEIDAKKTRLDTHFHQNPPGFYKDTDLQTSFHDFEVSYQTSKAQILSRVSELIQLTSDVEQFRRRREEISSLLKTTEEQLLLKDNERHESCNCNFSGSPSTTLDNTTNSTDITKHKHVVKLFIQFCTKMISTYAKDDTSRIQMTMEEVLQRNEELLHLNDLSQTEIAKPFCIKLYNFSESLLVIENTIQRLKLDIESHDPSKDFRKINIRIGDIKDMIAKKDSIFNELKKEEEANLSTLQMKSHTVQFEKLSTRWKNIQNKILGLPINKQDFNDNKNEGKENIKPGAMVLEEEGWIRERKKELDAMIIAGDSLSIAKQIESQELLKVDVDRRLEELQKKVHPHLQDTNVNRLDDNKKLDKCTSSMYKLIKQVEQWGIKLRDNHMKISILETSMTNLDYKLSQIRADSDMDQKPNKHGLSSNDDHTLLQEDISNILTQEKDLDISLSPPNKVLLESLKDRVKNISNSLENDDATETYCLPNGWERGIQDEIPYFINHYEESTQWDHPVFSELMNSLAEFNSVKFSAYRMALKLRRIQKKLCLEHLDLESAMFGFEMHGLTSNR